MREYDLLKKNLAKGWNTWNTRSVLSHVLLPDGFALNLGLKSYAQCAYLKEALIGREHIHPGPHSYDGSYTELNLKWNSVEVLVQSATDGDDLVLLVTPLAKEKKAAVLVVESGLLWNREGYVVREDGALVGCLPRRTVRVFGTQESGVEPNVAAQTPYLAMPLNGPVGLSTGKRRNTEEIRNILEQRKTEYIAGEKQFGELAEVYTAVQTGIAWDTIYEPLHDRVITPVSRLWNSNRGGYVLFCWDTYFAAYMAAIDNKDLAYANAIEITRERTDKGFVPNIAQGNGRKSLDRSQPPIGSLVVRELYRRFGDRWLLEEVFPVLLVWNRWWDGYRNNEGLLSWGTNPFEPVIGDPAESRQPNTLGGAALESGLDNSPMYDNIPFDTKTHLMGLADVGLNSLYVMDCHALTDIALVLGRNAEAEELCQRGKVYSERLATLWDKDAGIFLNRRIDTGEFNQRLSPTNFYALLSRLPTQAQAERMVKEHFYNPEEFWGEWIMPSISRNDSAYREQDYWRGRIWPPMNFLVYLGLRNYDLPKARVDLVEKSKKLFLKEWREHRHVHENYCANTGEGCNKPNSDCFYHWGGLLGLMAFIEAGYLKGPERPMKP